jgi:hypothetical protein
VATVTVDSTTQRYTSRVVQDPDILLLHSTEGMGWPGYNGGATAPHDTVKAIPGKGVHVRRHYAYNQFSKSLENDAGGVETNKRGVIQVELLGTCDPKHRGNPNWYYWPDADDAVLEGLADYYRPIMATHGIPARAMAEFVAYPKSYGNTPTRLTFSEWMNGSGICGHQHAPENAHGDPGDFPVDRFIKFLTGDDMPLTAAEFAKIADVAADEVWTRPVVDHTGARVPVGVAFGVMIRESHATFELTKALALKGSALTAAEVKAVVAEALDDKIADATTVLGVKETP